MQERNGAALGRVRLFGQAQSNEAYQIRDLLTRSVVAFDWIELGSEEDCRRELGLALTDVLSSCLTGARCLLPRCGNSPTGLAG